MTDAEAMTAFARKHFANEIGELTNAEEIGRLLVTRYTVGVRLWCGMRILRSLGVFVEQDGQRPS